MNHNEKQKEILEEIQIIFEDIKKNTKWEPNKLPRDVKIEIGDAPEYSESFGVDRKKDKLIFGQWIDEVEPKAVSNHFWDFLIIRESFALFFHEDLLYGEVSQLVNFLLNLLALSYLQISDPINARAKKFFPIQGRFLLPDKEMANIDKEIYSKINSLIEVINQGTDYKMLYNTFFSFLEDLEIKEIDSDEILDDLRRYLSNNPEEIAAPIFLKKTTSDVLMSLTKYGHEASANKIASDLAMNQSSIARQIAKLSSKFYSRWRLEKNYFKLGLHSYILIIRYPLNSQSALESVYQDLLKIEYFEKFFEGRNDEYLYHYTVIHCPHLISEKIAKKLSKYKQRGLIQSFDLKIIKNRIFRTNIVNTPFQPTSSNYEKLVNGEIPSNKLVLWDINYHNDVEKEAINKKDENVLDFLSLIISKSLTQSGLFGVHMKELRIFFEENGYDLNKQPECLKFINKLQNRAVELGLLDYRFNISLSGIASSNMAIFVIKNKENKNDIEKLIEKIAYFGWMAFVITSDNIYFVLLGPTYNHSLVKLISKIIKRNGFDCECFSVKQKIFRYIDYNSIYDYLSQKWAL